MRFLLFSVWLFVFVGCGLLESIGPIRSRALLNTAVRRAGCILRSHAMSTISDDEVNPKP